MDWVAIITAVIEAINSCKQQNRTDDQIFSAIREGGLQARFVLRAIGKQQGYEGRQLRQFVNECIQEVDNATDQEIWNLMSRQ